MEGGGGGGGGEERERKKVFGSGVLHPHRLLDILYLHVFAKLNKSTTLSEALHDF